MAVTVLHSVLKRGKPLDESFDRAHENERFAKLEPRDRAFARAIVFTGLRRTAQLRVIVGQFITKPLPEQRGQLDEILLAAAAQLVFLKVAPHAVINLAVFQVKGDDKARRFHRLANAVLRRISEQGATLAAEQDEVRHNTPDWLWQRWQDAYGADDAYRIAAQHLIEPPLDLTVKADAADWAKRLGGVVLPTGSVRVAVKGRIEDLEGYSAGEWWVQDAAASLPAQILGDVAGKRVADLCAAPGGKTAQLAHMAAKVWAVDASAKRMERLADNLKRLRLEAETEIIVADAAKWQPPELLDAVLLDAPCSATGTIRRHPDIPHLKTAASVDELAELQHKLLNHALTMLRPGGVLVYCVCSLESEEGPEQIVRLLAERQDVELSPISPDDVAGRGEWLDDKGALRTFPYFLQLSDPELGGMDGFYAARLLRTAA
jgi:16S rRNA (cytosine967-C5)-methyltransferase